MVNHTRLPSLSAEPIPSLALDVHRAGIPGHPGASAIISPLGFFRARFPDDCLFAAMGQIGKQRLRLC
jgi:hypothetical protein